MVDNVLLQEQDLSVIVLKHLPVISAKHQVCYHKTFQLLNVSYIAPTPCQPNPCQNGGSCAAQGTTSFLCQCPPGFYGYCCENRMTTTTPYNPCAQSPCRNGGTCIPQGTTFYCQCPTGFNGYCCENRITTTTPYNPCVQSPCQNGGTCLPQGVTFYCQCPAGFNGYCCENRITTTTPFNPCAASPCQNGATCIPTGSGKSSFQLERRIISHCHVFQCISVSVHLVSMVLDVNHAITACLIHALIMVYALKQQLVTYVHARILIRALIANKVCSLSLSCLKMNISLFTSDNYDNHHNDCRYTCTLSKLWMHCYSMSNSCSHKSLRTQSMVGFDSERIDRVLRCFSFATVKIWVDVPFKIMRLDVIVQMHIKATIVNIVR